MTENQQIRKEDVKIVFDSPYIKVADLQYAPGRHYCDSSQSGTGSEAASFL